MKKAFTLFAAAVSCLIAVPANAARQKTVTGSGNIVTEIRNVEAFHAVEAGRIGATELKAEQWKTTIEKPSTLKR